MNEDISYLVGSLVSFEDDDDADIVRLLAAAGKAGVRPAGPFLTRRRALRSLAAWSSGVTLIGAMSINNIR